ncbi:MAG: bacteriorhodopsin [Polaromonas sp.]|nr:bacteriorhodopsin [Polaromonas sp.]
MSTTLIQATDIASGTFSLLLVATLAATVLLLMGTAWVSKKWKLPVALAGLVTMVSAMHYFEVGQVWQASGQMPAIYRYIAWFVTMPLQVMTLYFFVGAMGSLSTWLFWRLFVVSVVMVLARYMGETNLMYPALGFLIGLVAWLYILGEVFFGRMGEVSAKSANFSVHRGYFWLRLIITVGWAVYPLCYFIVGFAGGAAENKLNITFNLADLVNQIAFGLAILTAAMKDSGSTR